ncbi:hypothetical protein OO015_00500 [Thermomicrobium sp. 4228-Ro]|uniref:hypothetical protein n=1 Tax=Thermomicrobium sp. 4228-Ro TaxID=2993937 RepID=UPI002248EC76|nr:hypothetical protein [Thermomicrobium sp. 4228-Ro]MCX2725987.1 hypothetical protein [Thermomicrobium sp. 4228-Ro]
MMGILRGLFSIGSPKETHDRQWQEITMAQRKVQELERRMRLNEQRRYYLRSPLLPGARVARFAREDAES